MGWNHGMELNAFVMALICTPNLYPKLICHLSLTDPPSASLCRLWTPLIFHPFLIPPFVFSYILPAVEPWGSRGNPETGDFQCFTKSALHMRVSSSEPHRDQYFPCIPAPASTRVQHLMCLRQAFVVNVTFR